MSAIVLFIRPCIVRLPVRASPPVAASRAPRPANVSRCETESVVVDDACHGVKPVLPAAVGLDSIVHTPVDVNYLPESDDVHGDTKTMETCTMNKKCSNDELVSYVDSTNYITLHSSYLEWPKYKTAKPCLLYTSPSPRDS